MTLKPPTRAMRENPDLNQLKRQAKELLEAYQASSPEALAEVGAYHRTATPGTFALHDAQFVLARAYGFESWPKLKAAVDGVTAAKLHQAVEAGDLETARNLLTRRPEIVDLGRGEMRALHMAVLRRDLDMTKLLAEFGADPDEGIWPNRDATGPIVIARERGYDEIAGVLEAAEETWHSGTIRADRRIGSSAFKAERGSDDRRAEDAFHLASCVAGGLTCCSMAGLLLSWRSAARCACDINGKTLKLDAARVCRHGGGNGFRQRDFERSPASLNMAPSCPLSVAGWPLGLSCECSAGVVGEGHPRAAVKGNHLDVVRNLLTSGRSRRSDTFGLLRSRHGRPRSTFSKPVSSTASKVHLYVAAARIERGRLFSAHRLPRVRGTHPEMIALAHRRRLDRSRRGRLCAPDRNRRRCSAAKSILTSSRMISRKHSCGTSGMGGRKLGSSRSVRMPSTC